jgi:putative CocE/NonD family hydrolase
MRIRHALFLPALMLAAHAPAAMADPLGLMPDPEPTWYQAAGADWSQATITSADGTALHADVLRPKGDTNADKTPVIVSIGPYFNHSGQTGPAGPAENTSYDPVGQGGVGPSDRFKDFVVGSGLLQKGYTFVMVDLRGFGGSGGCLDWGGTGEQADVVAAVDWAASQPWSTGKVGTYGKSYDAMTGLIAAALHPAGLGAVVAQEPVYDDYRYLYGDGIRRENAAATPALYDAIAATPGPLADDPTYNTGGATTPVCLGQNFIDQASNDDHTTAFWTQRNLITKVQGSEVPLFLTQGLTENNTAPDGTAQFLDAHKGYEHAWLGPWEHVRGNETCAAGDSSTGCTSTNVGRLKEGRAGWFDEVMRFYDQFLKGAQPTVQDPPIAVQTNDGKWRAEQTWPPADSTGYTTQLNKGSYADQGQSFATGDTDSTTAPSGVWTISPVLDHEVHLAGSGTASIDVTTTAPRANLVVDVYDLDKDGTGPLVSRQGHLLYGTGEQKIPLELWSADWKFAAGHRIGVRVTDTNMDWWLLTVPTMQTVTVNGGTISLPFLTYTRNATIAGDPGVQLATYLADTEDANAAVASSEDKGFNVPPAMVDPPAGDPGSPQAAAATQNPDGTFAPAAATHTAGSSARAARVVVRIGKGHRSLVAAGTAPAHSQVVVTLVRNGRVVATKRVRAGAHGAYRARFSHLEAGSYAFRVSARSGTRTLKATSKSARLR